MNEVVAHRMLHRHARPRRNRPRAASLSRRELKQQVKDARHSARESGLEPYIAKLDEVRPKTRADCMSGGSNAARPCPYVGCKWHLYLDVNPVTGTIKLNFPELEPWELEQSCCLDLADRGGMILEDVGAAGNVTRERVRQLELKTFPDLQVVIEALDPNLASELRETWVKKLEEKNLVDDDDEEDELDGHP